MFFFLLCFCTLMATMVSFQMPLYPLPKEPLPTKGPSRTSWKGVKSFVLEGSILQQGKRWAATLANLSKADCRQTLPQVLPCGTAGRLVIG